MAETIRILSAGAPKGGVGRCASTFARKTGHQVDVTFATAPALREKIESGDTGADILVAPVAHMEDYVAAGHVVAGTTIPVGSVRAGVAVRKGAAPPDISSVESLKAALLAADAVLYNRASSGQYIEGLMTKLGLAEALAAKTERFANGTAVMIRLAEGAAASEIGFGQVTEIRRFEGGGIALVGPLPEEIGKVTRYAAGLLARAAAANHVQALLNFMASTQAARIYAEMGLE